MSKDKVKRTLYTMAESQGKNTFVMCSCIKDMVLSLLVLILILHY